MRPRSTWRDDLTLATALLLTTAGLWAWFGYGALAAPGLVLLYLAIPQRQPFLPPRDRRT